MDAYRFLTYDEYDDATVVRICLNRPETRNAQNRGLLVELDEAFLRAEEDDRVRVVILGGAGPMFSSGHDLGSAVHLAELARGARAAPEPADQRWHPGRRREADAAGVALLLREHPALAQPAQDHHRPGARARCTPPGSC